ncbi:hypothetical protein FRB90_008531, partial [Tulasnella sp. 427]
MYAAKAVLTTLTVALPLVNAAVWNITVGGSAGLAFTPDQVTAAAGDTLHFEFASSDHSVTQSTFASPCSLMANGFDSGIQNQASAPAFDVTVNSTDPIWVYCKTPGHCRAGMVFAANAPSSGQTFDAFQAAAEGKSSGTSSGTSSTTATAAATTTTKSTSSAGSG